MDKPESLATNNAAPDPKLVEQLFARYAQRLARFADQHLSARLAARLDGEDVVQSVFRTFFRRYSSGEIRVDSSDEVWRLLVRITLRKAQAKGRYHTAAVRDVGAEVPAGDPPLLEAMAREPGPEEAATLVDEIEGLLRGLPELHCRILDLRLQGHAAADIADQLGTSRMNVYRALNLLQQRLEARAPAAAPPKIRGTGRPGSAMEKEEGGAPGEKAP